MVEGRNKDYCHITIDKLQDFEAVQLGHLHVQKYQIGLTLGNRLHRFEPIRAFSQDLDFAAGRQIFSQQLARQFFIIDNDRADAASLRDGSAPRRGRFRTRVTLQIFQIYQ